VQEHGTPCELVQRQPGGVRVAPVGDLGPAAAGGEHPGLRAADIGIEHCLELAGAGAAEDLVDDARLAQIDMRDVHHRNRLPLRPDVADDERQQAQYAARPLKGFDGRELRIQELQERRMERVVRHEPVAVIGPHRLVGQRRRGACVKLAIGTGGLLRRIGVDRREQAFCQDARQLRGLDRYHRRRVAGGHTLRIARGALGDRFGFGSAESGAAHLRQQLDEALGLPGKGIGGARQGHDNDEAGMGAGVAVQPKEEGGKLLGAVRAGHFEPGRVLRQLVEHDECLAALEHGIEIGRTGRRRGGRILADRPVERLAADLERDFAPQGVGDEFRALRPMHRQLVAGDAGDAAFATRLKRRAIDDGCGDLGEFAAAQRQMHQRDQRMRLAAAEPRFQSIDGRRRSVARETEQRLPQHKANSLRRCRAVAKERYRVGVEAVDLTAAAAVVGDDLRQARGKDLGVECALEDAVPRPAALDDAAQRTPACLALGVTVKAVNVRLRQSRDDE
jgi:hypothetical protein